MNKHESLYGKAEAYVEQSFSNTPGATTHLKRTAHWVDQLRPGAEQALLIAAVLHDIERAFPTDDKPPNTGFLDPEHLRWHQERSAEIARNFLIDQSAEETLVQRVGELIEHHEVGGDEEMDLLKETDSVSFFENNVEQFLTKKLAEEGREAIKEKFDWMFERIDSKEAREITREWYENAIGRLNAGNR